MTDTALLSQAFNLPPTGRWVVGVSGGADSVMLLTALLSFGSGLQLGAAHLNHQTRGAASDADATFVRALARSASVSFHEATLSSFGPLPTTGHEAAYRAARHRFFAQVVNETGARGVLLAHHADDRAETLLLRLLRGGEASSLDGLRSDATITTEWGPLRIHRPLLALRRALLRRWLESIGQAWREDSSNACHDFARNRVRSFLRDRPAVVEPLLMLAESVDRLRNWSRANTPRLELTFNTATLGDLPDPLARPAARRWLIDRGAPADQISAEAAERLIQMCRDRSTGARHDFAGGMRVWRKGQTISG